MRLIFRHDPLLFPPRDDLPLMDNGFVTRSQKINDTILVDKVNPLSNHLNNSYEKGDVFMKHFSVSCIIVSFLN